MKIKPYSRLDSTLFVVKNILLAILIIAVLLVVLFFWLRHYTEHGVEVTVPNVVGMYQAEAETQLKAASLALEISDSTYSDRVPLGTIVEQLPPANSHAKTGRTVYVIINANSRRQIPLPDLHDLSYRQAEATLRSIGLDVDPNYEYEPSEYKDLVLDVKWQGRSLVPGDRVDEGSKLTLVVGFGKGTEKVAVPNVIGMTLQDARSLLLSRRLTVGTTDYDTPVDAATPDDKEPVVYMQTPNVGEMLLEGSMVNLKLSVDVEKAVMTNNEETEEDFF